MTIDRDTLALVKLRSAVGYLGERSNGGWWPCDFFSNESAAFLSPVFPRSTWNARFFAVSEAASRIHDEHIGIGRVFHLFRLHESLEQRLSVALSESEETHELSSICGCADTAMAYLEQIASSAKAAAHSGPVRIDSTHNVLDPSVLTILAATYRGAFRSDSRVFPFFSESA